MLTNPGRPREHHVLFLGNEVEGSHGGRSLVFETPGVVEVKLFQRFPRGHRGDLTALSLTTVENQASRGG